LQSGRTHSYLRLRDEPSNVPLIRDARDNEAEAMRRLLRDYERSIEVDL
jgi:hypothetical protein